VLHQRTARRLWVIDIRIDGRLAQSSTVDSSPAAGRHVDGTNSRRRRGSQSARRGWPRKGVDSTRRGSGRGASSATPRGQISDKPLKKFKKFHMDQGIGWRGPWSRGALPSLVGAGSRGGTGANETCCRECFGPASAFQASFSFASLPLPSISLLDKIARILPTAEVRDRVRQ
jgi:hypothetical protein